MSVTQAGPGNPNWKGGRTIASNGYVLLRIPDHPNADSRGYVYEHRVVAEKKIGRPLRPGEHVHHLNHDKRDNSPENVEVLTSAEHRRKHRYYDSALRNPGERNDLVLCACGCGTEFRKFDADGRPRQFVTGHNRQASPTTDAILGCLAGGQQQRGAIVAATGLSVHAVGVALSKLKRAGKVRQAGHGVWALAEESHG